MGLRVLIAVDASEHASRAFDFYFEHLHKKDNELVVIHSAEQPKLPTMSIKDGPLALPVEQWQEALTRRQSEVNKVEADYINRLVQNKVQYKVRLMFGGKPGETICDIAKEEGVNFIVLGTRGLGSLRRTFLGSVSDYVVHHANVPVTIVPAPAKGAEGASN